jgi:hypothetical protein
MELALPQLTRRSLAWTDRRVAAAYPYADSAVVPYGIGGHPKEG